jgi:hypothetical protein
MLDLELAGCSAHSAVHPVSGSEQRELPTFQNYVHHREWNLYVNIGLYSKSTNSIPVTISPTFRNNRINLECE